MFLIEELEFHPGEPILKYQARENFYDKELTKDCVEPSDNKEKIKEDFVTPISEIDKRTK